MGPTDRSTTIPLLRPTSMEDVDKRLPLHLPKWQKTIPVSEVTPETPPGVTHDGGLFHPVEEVVRGNGSAKMDVDGAKLCSGSPENRHGNLLLPPTSGGPGRGGWQPVVSELEVGPIGPRWTVNGSTGLGAKAGSHRDLPDRPPDSLSGLGTVMRPQPSVGNRRSYRGPKVYTHSQVRQETLSRLRTSSLHWKLWGSHPQGRRPGCTCPGLRPHPRRLSPKTCHDTVVRGAGDARPVAPGSPPVPTPSTHTYTGPARQHSAVTPTALVRNTGPDSALGPSGCLSVTTCLPDSSRVPLVSPARDTVRCTRTRPGARTGPL